MSHFPSYVFELEDLQQLLDILNDKPGKSFQTLENILQRYGFSAELAQVIRQDPGVRWRVIRRLRRAVESSQEVWEDEWIQAYQSNIEQRLIDEDIDLHTLTVLESHPRIVKALEAHFKIPVTGIYSKFLDNYRQRKYTRRCQAYGHTKDFCLKNGAKYGHLDVVRTIIDQDVNRELDYDSSLANAAYEGHLDVVKAVVESGAEGLDFDWATSYAIKGGHREIIKYLLENNPNPGVDVELMFFGAAGGGQIAIMQRLLESNLVFDDRHRMYNYALRAAAGMGQIAALEWLINLGADDFVDAAMMAAEYGRLEILTVLLERIEDVDELNMVMTSAASHGQVEAVKLLLAAGANNYGPVMRSASFGKGSFGLEIIRLMLDRGANNIDDLNYVLVNAAQDGDMRLAELMLDKGANNFNEAIGHAEARGTWGLPI